MSNMDATLIYISRWWCVALTRAPVLQIGLDFDMDVVRILFHLKMKNPKYFGFL